MVRTCILALYIILCASTSCIAIDVTIAWDCDCPTSYTYTLHYGTQSKIYSNSINAGANKQTTATDLVDGKTYFFAATSKDQYGDESDYSEELVVDTSSMFTFW